MPALQTLVLTDRATPAPVSHTFNPSRMVGDVGEVTNPSSSGVPAGAEVFTISMKKGGDNRYKGKLKLILPILVTETINGVSRPSVARQTIVNLSFDFDQNSTTQERKDAIGMAYSALDPTKVLVNNTLVNVESVW